MFSIIETHWNYMIVVILMMIGLYMVMSRMNLVKKLIGLSTFKLRCSYCISQLAALLAARHQSLAMTRITSIQIHCLMC